MVIPSPGVIMHFIPFSVIEQVTRQDIGTIIATGIPGDIPIGVGCIIGICMGAAGCDNVDPVVSQRCVQDNGYSAAILDDPGVVYTAKPAGASGR